MKSNNSYLRITIPIGIIVVVLILACVFISFISSLMNLFNSPLENRIFGSMEELTAFDAYVIDELDPKSDKQLDGLEYTDSYTKVLEYQGRKYYLYAYKFKNQTDAQIYLYGTKKSETLKQSFRYSYNESRYVAFYHEYAYCLDGNNHKDFAEFYNMATKDFTIIF